MIMKTKLTERHFGPLCFIPGRNRGRYPFCHSLYVEGAGILLDPSSNKEMLTRLGEDGHIKNIWLTHWHEDHWRYLYLFDDLPLWMSEQDAIPHTDIECYLDWYGMHVASEKLRNNFRDYLLKRFCFKPSKPTRFLKDGEIINLGSVTVEVIHTPGHSPGHLSFFFKEPKLLFLGDYQFSSFGPWYGDPNSHLDDTISSMERLRKVPAKIWITSHEIGIFEQEPGILWDRYIDTIRKREEKLLQFLSEPHTLQEIVRTGIVLGPSQGPIDFFELREGAIISKHIERVIEYGRVTVENGKYVRTGPVETTL